MSSPVGAVPLPADPVVGTSVQADDAPPPSLVSFPHAFELWCGEVQPLHCDVRLRAACPEHVVMLACEHGPWAHGYTRAWYRPDRLAAMAARVTRHSQ